MKKINMKKLFSKFLVFGLPLILVGTLVVAYFVGTQKVENPMDNKPVQGENSKVKRKIYLKNNEGLLVPLSLSIDAFEDRVDEIKYLISNLKKDIEVEKGYIGLLDNDVELLNVTLEDSKLTLDFNEAFNKYDKNDEIRIIEALIWTCAQYRDISQIKILVNGQELTKMPLGNCPVPKVLDKSFGINNHIFMPRNELDNVTVYFEDITSKTYIPVTLRVEEKEDKISTIVSAFNKSVPTYLGIKKASVLNKIEFSDIPSMLDGTLNIDLTASSLVDETTVDRDVYEYLVMNFRDNIETVETVNVIVQDEIMSVNGYKDEIIPVGSIYENVIGI